MLHLDPSSPLKTAEHRLAAVAAGRDVEPPRLKPHVSATTSMGADEMAELRRRILFCVVTLAINQSAFGQANLEITLKQGTPDEARTRDQLQRLLATYNLSPWIYTKSIVVDERAIPFSHPVLTIHTRHAKDDKLLLSTFVHEQLHWFIAARPDETEQAIADLRKLFPSVPAGGTAGARDEYSTYLHLLVCYLERQAVLRVLGELKTKQVMDFWATDHYTWVYQTVISRSRDIGQIMRDRKLIPAR